MKAVQIIAVSTTDLIVSIFSSDTQLQIINSCPHEITSLAASRSLIVGKSQVRFQVIITQSAHLSHASTIDSSMGLLLISVECFT